MKKMSVIIASLCVFSAAAMAADPVYSVNTVGFSSKQTASTVTNKYYMMGGGFAKVGGSENVLLSDLLGTNGIPNASVVFFWNGSQYVGETFAGGRWLPGTNLVSRSEGFWFKAASAATIYCSGEVPGGVLSTTVTAIAPGYNMLAYPYPVQRYIRDMAFTNCAAVGDVIFKWVPATASWSGSTYIGGATKWTVNLQFDPCEGFWYKRGASAGSTNWVEVKPY